MSFLWPGQRPGHLCLTRGETHLGKRRSLRVLQTMKFFGAWLVPWRSAFLTRADQSKLQFFVSHRDGIGRQIAKYGGIEPELTAWIGRTLQQSPSGIVIDVGANLGWHSLHAAKYETVETIVAFEPDAFNAWLFERNLAINAIDKVIVEACAVGAESGLARLYRYKPSNKGRHSLLKDYGLGSRLVPVVDVDSALSSLGLAERRVLLLKIDVEGYEPSVIAGATRTLERTDVLITEYSPALSRSGNLSVDEMTNRLIAGGFKPHLLADNGIIAPIDRDVLQNVEHQTDVIWTR
jgi:FkbM family methyltransferase